MLIMIVKMNVKIITYLAFSCLLCDLWNSVKRKKEIEPDIAF